MRGGGGRTLARFGHKFCGKTLKVLKRNPPKQKKMANSSSIVHSGVKVRQPLLPLFLHFAGFFTDLLQAKKEGKLRHPKLI